MGFILLDTLSKYNCFCCLYSLSDLSAINIVLRILFHDPDTMAFIPNPFPIDPEYGKIGPMCAYLGYTDHKGARYQNTLSNATIAHRREFIDKTQGLTQFPTDENAYEARACARTFLDANPGFFEYSDEASSSRFPIYPQDRNKYESPLTLADCSHTCLIRSTE